MSTSNFDCFLVAPIELSDEIVFKLRWYDTSMHVTFDAPALDSPTREMPVPPREGETIYLNGGRFDVVAVMWHDPGEPGEQGVTVELAQ